MKVITLARKPCKRTVAITAMEYGTSGININSSRIEVEGEGRLLRVGDPKQTVNATFEGRRQAGEGFNGGSKAAGVTDLGRWPANVILQHHPKCSVECHPECACASLDEQSGVCTSGSVKPGYMKNSTRQASGGGFEGGFQDIPLTGYGDSGGASRFFKQVKP